LWSLAASRWATAKSSAALENRRLRLEKPGPLPPESASILRFMDWNRCGACGFDVRNSGHTK
jgi:hypothetical protein